MFHVKTSNDNSTVKQGTRFQAMQNSAFHSAVLRLEIRKALTDLIKTLEATKAIAVS